MLYESDVSSLLSQWQKELKESTDASYKDGIRDCIYDLKMLMDNRFQEEALANESFEQQLKEDAELWDEYLCTDYIEDKEFAA